MKYLRVGKDEDLSVPRYLAMDQIYGRRGTPSPESIKGLLMPEMIREIGGHIDTGRLLEKLNIPHKDLDADEVQRIHNLQLARGRYAHYHRESPFNFPQCIDVPVNETLEAWNVASAGSRTDVHIDRGMANVSWSVGCVKVWLLWNWRQAPNTNFYKAWAQDVVNPSDDPLDTPIIRKVAPNLKNMRIATTDASHALFIPPGWWHAVFTIKGGLLGGMTYRSRVHVGDGVISVLRNFDQEVRAILNEVRSIVPRDHQRIMDEINQNTIFVVNTMRNHIYLIQDATSAEEVTKRDEYRAQYYSVLQMLQHPGFAAIVRATQLGTAIRSLATTIAVNRPAPPRLPRYRRM